MGPERNQADARGAVCHCRLTREKDQYAKPTLAGRRHATEHHYVAERFLGRSKNRPGTQTRGIFAGPPWPEASKTGLFCYECHEELLHDPVLLSEDVAAFAKLVQSRQLGEDEKPEDRRKIAGRIELLHEVITVGLRQLAERPASGGPA